MKKFSLLLLTTLLLLGCSTVIPSTSVESTNQNHSTETEKHTASFVYVKYRSDPVDIAASQFESLNTSKSSFVGGAWYDGDNKYMVIKLNDTYYHYCGIPQSMWREFKKASSFGKKYLASIKGNYDCRLGVVPKY